MIMTDNRYAAMCIYCGEAVIYDTREVTDMDAAHQKLVEHDQKCQENPLVAKLNALQKTLAASEEKEQALAAHVERIAAYKDWLERKGLMPARLAGIIEEVPETSMALLVAEKQAEGMESLVPKVADGIGRSLSLSEDDIITLEEWIGDLAEVHREAEEAAK